MKPRPLDLKSSLNIFDFFVECAPGTARGAAVCYKCPRGTYSTEIDAPYCHACPEGYSTVWRGETSASACWGNVIYLSRDLFFYAVNLR